MSSLIRRTILLFLYPTLVFAFLLPAAGVIAIDGGIFWALGLGFVFSCAVFGSLFLMDMGNDAIDAMSNPKHLTLRNSFGWGMVLAFFLTPGLVLKLMGLLAGTLTVTGWVWPLVAGVAIMLGGLIVRLILLD